MSYYRQDKKKYKSDQQKSDSSSSLSKTTERWKTFRACLVEVFCTYLEKIEQMQKKSELLAIIPIPLIETPEEREQRIIAKQKLLGEDWWRSSKFAKMSHKILGQPAICPARGK